MRDFVKDWNNREPSKLFYPTEITPYQKAEHAHESDPSTVNDPIEDAILDHIKAESGVVVSTPDLFLLARPVDLSADPLLFDEPGIAFDNPDCWHIYLAAGPLDLLFNALPYPLPFVSYVRKNRLHFQNMKKMGLKVNSSTFSEHGRKTKACGGSEPGESTRGK